MNSSFEQVQIKRLERDGVALAYRYLPGDGPGKAPIVFIHGWAGTGEDWRLLVERYVAQGEGVLVYDAAGFGQSQFESEAVARRADYSLTRYVEDLKAIIQAEKLERVRLVGHSWGGVVAMCFAARYPAQTESLVAIGSAYFDPQNRLHQILKWVSYLIGQLLVISKPLLRRFGRLQKIAVYRYLYRPPTQAETDLIISGVLQSNNRAVIQTLLTGYEVQFKEICPAIQCPTLYIGGAQDVVAPLPSVLAFVPLTPGATSLILENCGHFPMLEQPDALIAALEELTRQSG